MHKMGSPWPWTTQQEVKPPTSSIIPSIHHTNGNGHAGSKRANGYGNGYAGGGQYANGSPAYYNYQQNNQQNYNQTHHHHPAQHPHPEGPQQDQNQNQHQHPQHQNLPPYHHPHNRYIPTSPPSSAVLSPMEEGGNNEGMNQHRNKRPAQQTYFTFEGMQNNNNNNHLNNHHHHPQQNHHRNGHHHPFTPPARKYSSTSSSPSPASASSPTITTTTGPIPNPLSSHNSYNLQQSPYVNCVKGIPTWNRYYSDQKHRIIDFTDKNNSIRPDSLINQLVSLCFVDTCITNLDVDAIVNSTTEDYAGIAGVDKMIHQQAGSNLREACKALPRLAPGQAEMTLGFELPAKYVIHSNGPLTEGDAVEQLTGCYVNSFNLLLRNRLRTIAFPCISTGRKGLSKKFAADIALRTVRRFLEEHRHSVDRVIFVLHHQKDIEIYLRYMQIYFPVEPPFATTIMIT